MVIWIVGLSGAGKTTLGSAIYRRFKERNSNTVLIDGDEIRQMFLHDLNPEAYTVEGRRINVERVHALCSWLDRQDINVVCCILSIFSDIHLRNRETFSRYFEVFLTAPLEALVQRDKKGLYANALRGTRTNVVGVDIPYTHPEYPDLIIDTSDPKADIERLAEEVLARAAGTR